MLTGKGFIRVWYGFEGIKKEKKQSRLLEQYYQNQPRFNGVCSRNNVHDKIKDGAYVINIDEYSDIGTHQDCFTCFK